MILSVMEQFAVQKGLDILTAADWTHPVWFQALRDQLEEAGEGLYRLRDQGERERGGGCFVFVVYGDCEYL